ncbi:hypothetical protein [Methanobacterium sp. SMA-27]|uniref:hypothetical protein n=1 Tax=Methanobacterium sp. SMA-27 TaxID=1495336 RepID=UPI00064E8BE9|nr:hypothetical protein [Methanobacterium sp. SMA-27]
MKINPNKLPQIKQINLGDTLKEVRKNQDDIVFEPGITILSQQPGTGKSTLLKKYLQATDEKWVLTVPNHTLIESEYGKIKKIKGVNAWKGFSKACPKYIGKDTHVRKLKDRYGFNAGLICSNACTKDEQKKCPYKKQFKNPKNIITVSAYHNTQYFYDKEKFRFDIAIIDESLQGHKPLELKKDEIRKSIDLIYDYIDNPQIKMYFMDIIEKKELFLYDINLEHGKAIIDLVSTDQRKAVQKALNQKKDSDIKTINKLKIYDIIKWLYYYSIYQEDRIYGDPYIYRIFDLARQGVKVVFADASFNLSLFQSLLGRYQHEDKLIPRSKLLKTKDLKPIENLEIKLYSSHIKNDDLTIYRMWGENSFYKEHLRRNKDDLQYFIDQTRRKHPNIGIITYKKHLGLFNKEDESTYFGNLRGLNSFEKKDAMFIIGSYLTNHEAIVNDYNALFLTNHEIGIDTWRPRYIETNVKDSEFQGDYYQEWKINGDLFNLTIPGGFDEKNPEPVQEVPKKYKNLQEDEHIFIPELKAYNESCVNVIILNELKLKEALKKGSVDIEVLFPINLYDKHLFDSEIYQAIHRARPINNPDIPIYVFGYIPLDIKNEFNTLYVRYDNTKVYFMEDFKGVCPSILVGSIQHYCYKNPKDGSLDVAKAFSLYKENRKDYNTPFITYIRNGIKTTEVNRINDLIKKGVHTIAGFEKEYKKLKKQALIKDKDFINFVKYCIYYSDDEKQTRIILPSY